jgi:AraC family transcriptional regulator
VIAYRVGRESEAIPPFPTQQWRDPLAALAPPALRESPSSRDLSARQLTRAFRVSQGCSIGQYVAQRQVERARRLLATGETIKSIASSLGFASPSNFSSAFRHATGQTPRAFQREVRVAGNASRIAPAGFMRE